MRKTGLAHLLHELLKEPVQDTFETSLCTHHLFPTDDGPEYR